MKTQDFRFCLAVMMTISFIAWRLRLVHTLFNPSAFGYLGLASGILAFTLATTSFVRFCGTKDRTALILACGFALAAMIAMRSGLRDLQLAGADGAAFPQSSTSLTIGPPPMAALLVAALVSENGLSMAFFSGLETAGAIVILLAALLLPGLMPVNVSGGMAAFPAALVPQPWHLLVAGIFIAAALGMRCRLKRTNSMFDRGLFLAALLNLAAQLAASQSERLLDAPILFSQSLSVAAYGVALLGALLDDVRLFDQIERLEMSDALTDLANYRRMRDVLEKEIATSERTGRPFSILLLDLDDLKKINDSYGHLFGTRAICRLAEILRIHCRPMDTAARYGGDEFVLVLPEAGLEQASRVAKRIHTQLVSASDDPPLSASIGAACYPRDGNTIEELVDAADKALYAAKAHHRKELARTRKFFNVAQIEARVSEGSMFGDHSRLPETRPAYF